jgi:hypothetical protein
MRPRSFRRLRRFGFGDIVGSDVDGFDDRAAAFRGDQRVLCARYQRNNRRGPGAEPGLCRC